MDTQMLTIQDIRHRLKDYPATSTLSGLTQDLFDIPARPAAVLIPLLQTPLNGKKNSWHILYTRRTDAVADHKGQISFPGGRLEPEDSVLEVTALREAHEEIGLLPKDVTILGKLDSLYTITNYLVTPIVGLIPWPYPLKLESREVSKAFAIPLSWLINPENYEIGTREVLFTGEAVPRQLKVIYFKPYDGEILWGVSAEITIRFLYRLGLTTFGGTNR